MDDLRVVMEAVGTERGAVLATFEAAAMATLFAATYPERVGALVLFNPYAKAVASDDYPWGKTPEEWRRDLAEIERGWGSVEYFDRVLERSYQPLAHDESWQFLSLGKYLERADNVSRLLRLHCRLLTGGSTPHGDETVRWLAVLRSAGSRYRRRSASMWLSSPGLTAATKSGFSRSRTWGSACGTSQSGVSITWESASCTTRPST